MKGIRKRVGALLALLTIKLDTLSIDLVQTRSHGHFSVFTTCIPRDIES